MGHLTNRGSIISCVNFSSPNNTFPSPNEIGYSLNPPSFEIVFVLGRSNIVDKLGDLFSLVLLPPDGLPLLKSNIEPVPPSPNNFPVPYPKLISVPLNFFL